MTQKVVAYNELLGNFDIFVNELESKRKGYHDVEELVLEASTKKEDVLDQKLTASQVARVCMVFPNLRRLRCAVQSLEKMALDALATLKSLVVLDMTIYEDCTSVAHIAAMPGLRQLSLCWRDYPDLDLSRTRLSNLSPLTLDVVRLEPEVVRLEPSVVRLEPDVACLKASSGSNGSKGGGGGEIKATFGELGMWVMDPESVARNIKVQTFVGHPFYGALPGTTQLHQCLRELQLACPALDFAPTGPSTCAQKTLLQSLSVETAPINLFPLATTALTPLAL